MPRRHSRPLRFPSSKVGPRRQSFYKSPSLTRDSNGQPVLRTTGLDHFNDDPSLIGYYEEIPGVWETSKFQGQCHRGQPPIVFYYNKSLWADGRHKAGQDGLSG